ncbi:alpha-amylase family glycosyl hydrolase [Halobacillus sp. Marseille-Q1614]|uniref:alpha-amylase family glycosyl hydrolase n=1 Tax=Halobacillus sp. Marseille-Q1614 TaxID=2709134 RepID=UPI00156E2B0F|nr:alpha-amylase family glycosyl hydrolase [Halobacillus sp. Marseille-Q1614]
MRRCYQFLMIIPFLLFCSFEKAEAAEKEERQWQDESMYYIMIDRFMNGDSGNDNNVDTENPEAYHGGDLQGVIKQLDYIKDMGFTSIVLSPIMENEESGFHGYWTEDYQAVEESFGTIEDAKRLVEEVHERDLKIVFDLVVSHTSRDHKWLQENEDWYLEDTSETDGPLSGLPELNTENPDVQNYFIETAEWWVEQTNVDGFQLQGTPSDEFVEEFSLALLEIDENAIVMAGAEADVENVSYTIPEFQENAAEAFNTPDTSLGNLYEPWVQIKQQGTSAYMANHYIDKPFSDRLTRLAVREGENPITRWKLALIHSFTYPGIPVTLYGTEIPLDEGKDMEYNQLMSFKGGNDEISQMIEKLNSIRNEFPVLTRGSYKELYNENGLIVYERKLEDQTMIIAINNATKTRATELKHLLDDRQLRGLIQDGMIRQSDDGSYRIAMERETSDIFIVEENAGFNWLFIGFVGGVLLLFVIAVIAISIRSKKNVTN